MTENDTLVKKSKSRMNLRSLRLSLKYRPQLFKLILKMRQCIRRRNSLLKSLKDRLNNLESKSERVKDSSTNSVTNISEKDETSKNGSDSQSLAGIKTKKKVKNMSTQTVNDIKNQENKIDAPKENAGWNLKENGEAEKSIAEQVKEAAQSALQDSGMVYVESAGMYYDYKTGYYYNSELGLYYHSDTGCYYYYSDDKKFVFHSYPDMSKVNTSLVAHQKKQARKLKRERKPEDDIDNLTKHLSQDKEEDASNPKKPRKSKKPKKQKKERKEERKEKKEKDKKSKKREEQKMERIESKIQNTEEKKDNEDALEEKTPKEDVSTKNENVDLSTETKNQDGAEQCKDHESTMDIFDTNDDTNKAMIVDKNDIETKNDNEKSNDSGEANDSDVKIERNDQSDSKVELESKLEIETKDQGNEEVKEETGELEDGECSETESEDSGSESEASTSTVSDEDSIAKNHPPCMRVIVRETSLPKLKVGSLFLITKDGGTIGREGDQHTVLLKDHNVSRNHLDIRYDIARMTYIATDLGSKNGSILNGVRMSESQEVSLPLDVLHGSTIQLGETKLLCHVHPGHTTCGQCEPGLVMQVEEEKKAAYTRTVSVKKQHELELARLKNIYAPQRLAIEEKPYNDRAQARRETVGSTNHAEKTVASDLDTSIAPDNKGFKLLQKMGWSKGEGLGKDSQGETEPVPLTSNEGKAGLGNSGAVAPPSNRPKPRVIKNNLASATMRLAARTKMLQPPAKAFQNEDDDEEA